MLVVGVCRLELGLGDNFSLKGKRSVIRSVIARTRRRFNVAMAEVDDNDFLGHAVLGFVVVGNDSRFVNSCVDKIVDFVDNIGDAPVADYDFEILTY